MNVLELFSKITTFVFDVDGVLTDGTVLVLPNGVQARQMHIKDGFGLQMATRNGFKVVIVSGGTSEPVVDRLNRLGITEVYMTVIDKKEFLETYMNKKGLKWNELLYMADDLPDLEVMKHCGVSACPADAVTEVKDIAHYISPINGGFGCVREVIEKVLKVQGKWNYGTDVVSK
ncbi:MAG: 3-deoxy-D-manno-octulosonate 8-phosphate phosphatase [Bacteroidetes bacterium]|nr:MAG: 3-deoxy-D-manno-octulosonate 8-phosphate phosphatase [Bacteroidota bacterium]